MCTPRATVRAVMATGPVFFSRHEVGGKSRSALLLGRRRIRAAKVVGDRDLLSGEFRSRLGGRPRSRWPAPTSDVPAEFQFALQPVAFGSVPLSRIGGEGPVPRSPGRPPRRSGRHTCCVPKRIERCRQPRPMAPAAPPTGSRSDDSGVARIAREVLIAPGYHVGCRPR